MKIDRGSRVRLHFRLSLENGFIVEDTFGDEPLEIQIGAGELLPELERKLMDMEPGSTQEVVLQPHDAYGFPEPDRVFEMPREDFPESLEIEKGKIVGFTAPSGQEVAGTILEIGPETVRVDFNHPLAGKTVVFDVEILEVLSE